MRSRLIAAGIALASTPSLLAQTVTVAVEGPATVRAGETVTIGVYAESPDLPSSGAFAGYGLNVHFSTGANVVAGLSEASSPVLTVGVLPGTLGPASIDRAVGGQLPNIFGLNPSVDQSSSILLFAFDLSIEETAGSGDEITLEASAASNGGIVIYPDITSGASVTVPDDSDTSLIFVPLTIMVEPSLCDADTNGDGEVNFDDLNLVLGTWGDTVMPGSGGDVTGDGSVNFDDLNLILNRWGEVCP